MVKMNVKTLVLLMLNVLAFQVIVGTIYLKKRSLQPPVQQAPETPSSPLIEQPVQPPINIEISNDSPSFMDYTKTIAQLNKWHEEAPAITEVGVIGNSSKGKGIGYLRIVNRSSYTVADKPRVLITACIHGNEPLASSTVMWYIGHLLNSYGDDQKITELIDSRDIYFVPVISPDSYPHTRYVDGVDPNRNFPGPTNPNLRSVPPVAALQEFFLRIKPNAVMSGHTWGRVFLVPYGDRMEDSPNQADYKRIVGKMADLSGYRFLRACDLYLGNGRLNNPPIRALGQPQGVYKTSVPIYGTEVDWYYRHGAFAVITEFGTHQRIPTDQDTRTEFDKTYKAVLHFIQEAPLVSVQSE